MANTRHLTPRATAARTSLVHAAAARTARRLAREYAAARAKISSNGLRAWLATLPGSSSAERLCHNPADHIWLTFDDYATPSQIRRLLAILAEHNVAAGFFLTGSWARRHTALVTEIRAAGHVVGSHGMEHKKLRTLTADELLAELSDGLGTRHFRPPYGEFNPATRKLARNLGQAIGHWTFDSQDWRGISPSHIQHNVISRLHPGAVVLFHLHVDNTLEVLPELIGRIRRHGFTLPPLTSRPARPAAKRSKA
jgi:peptidoglycan/xylan/chitin deacetylase (PgdA/CDA1 family)